MRSCGLSHGWDRLTTSHRRGWLVFAAAFVAVAVIGLIPILNNPETQQPGTSETSTTQLAPPTTTTIPATTTTLDEVCSASLVEIPPAPSDLPSAAADKFQAIVEAASSCSFRELAKIAADGFITGFGDGGVESFEIWENRDDGHLGTILKVLATSYDTVETQDAGTIYVWPAAFRYDMWDEIPPEYLEELLTLYTQDELDQMSGFGSYAGWRTGIDQDGNWLFFVAGD